MPDPAWYRSLYWRIALGFVVLLATLLVAQGLVFLWMTGRMTDFFPNRSPAQLAASIANDVASAIAVRPDADISALINGKYSNSSRGFVVAFDDGRPLVVSQRVPSPPGLDRMAWSRLREAKYPDRRPRGRGFGGALGESSFARGGREAFGGMFGPGGQGIEFAPVRVNDVLIGMTAVPVAPAPLSFALRNLGPTLAGVALGLLVAGTAVSALLIFRPVRRRLESLAEAARAIGAGDLAARAPESGGDEVTSLARAFNDMAVELEQRTAALEEANRVRRQLLADVSHELTTPLAAVRGYVETLTMEGLALDEATRRRYLGIVTEETARLEHIVGDLLDVGRLEGGAGVFRIGDVPLDQLFTRLRDRHGHLLADKHVTLVTDHDEQTSTIAADPNRLEQALQNLVANAVRHTPPGGTVFVRARRDRADVVLTVEDTGAGIPEAHLARVFDRFYKADESRAGTDTPSGSGLGLSIVRAIVVRHGGTVAASNVPGGGARFDIRLPAAPAPVARG